MLGRPSTICRLGEYTLSDYPSKLVRVLLLAWRQQQASWTESAHKAAVLSIWIYKCNASSLMSPPPSGHRSGRRGIPARVCGRAPQRATAAAALPYPMGTVTGIPARNTP
eukprot:1120573-Prorocentrum_minimum.AAC.1